MNKTEAENKGLDKGFFDLLLTLWDTQACHQTMGLKITYLGTGVAGIKKFPNSNFATDGGRVHGGVIATLADTVMGAAAATIGDQRIYRTVEMKLNYLAPIFENVILTAEAHVVHPGKTLAVVEANLFNNEGKLVTRSMGTYFNDIKSKKLIDQCGPLGI
jgi:acyl-CoA thioesterase